MRSTPARDLGKTWERRDSGIGDKEIYSLATQMVNGKPRVYAGTQPAHLYYSDDLGKSWTELPGLRQVPGVEKWTFPGPPHLAHVKSITFHPKDPNIIHVAVEVGGFLKSTDGGKTWTTIDNINPDAHRVLVPTNDPSKLYGTAPTTNCGPETAAGFCVSSDGGASWKSMTPRDFRIGYVDPFFVHPSDPNLLFVAGAKTGPGTWRKLHTADARIARSRDGGKSLGNADRRVARAYSGEYRRHGDGRVERRLRDFRRHHGRRCLLQRRRRRITGRRSSKASARFPNRTITSICRWTNRRRITKSLP